MTKKIIKAARYFVALGLILAVFAFLNIARAETEVIQNFNANISIQNDGSIFITEKIIYNFGSNQKHGIFRDIPLTAVNGPRLSINVFGVSDEAGQTYQYTTSIRNNILRIKIGNPNVLISGVKTYVINYQVYNSIRTFNDHDELYWNVTGNQWPVTIQNANASVILPDPSITNVLMDCFTGPQGSIQKNCTFNQNGSTVNYSSSQPLNAGEGLTFVLGIPLGFINNTYVPTQQNYTTNNTSSDYNFLSFLFRFTPLFYIIFIFIAEKAFRQVAKTKPKPVIPKELRDQPLVVEYNPPDNLPPIEIGTLLDRRVDITDISSVIVDLAIRGYIKIRYTAQQIRFWPDKKDFELIKLKDGADLIHPADKIIFSLFFDGRDSVKLSDLKEQKTTFQAAIVKIQKDTDQYLYDEGYFDQAAKDKSEKLTPFLPIVVIVLYVGFSKAKIFPSGFDFMGIVLIASIVIILDIVIKKLVHKLTPQGLSTLRKILGFREFLQLTEKDKLQLLNAPELQPEMFEKFLPYAMVLGVEDKWAQKFEGIYNTIPNWYEDSTATSFNSYMLARNLTLFEGSFNKVFNITSSRSSSGFGGGGSSGGGSGGGGGGSW